MSLFSLLANLFAGAGTPWSPVGHDEVIKMHYWIGIGRIEVGMPETPLAWTTSYTTGVSLSEIKWGFYNPSDPGSDSSAFLEFTLHDIAGQTMSDFIKIKTGQYAIYFHGPTSGGDFWFGNMAVYYPNQESCDLQFSQTQGFTYKFSAKPIGELAKSKLIAPTSKITINGINEGNVAHGNTFKDYLQELETKWNKMLTESPDKANTAKIKIQMRPEEAANDDALKQPPVHVEKEKKGQPAGKTATGAAKIDQISFTQFDPISSVIQALWQKRFVPAEAAPEKKIDKNSQLEVSWCKYEGGETVIDVKCHKTGVTDNVPNTFFLCVGTDDVCDGFPYRAQIAAINFKGMFTLLAAEKMNNPKGMGSAEMSQQGNQENVPVSHAKTTPVAESTQKEATMAALAWAAGIGAGVNPQYDGWGQFRTLLNKHKIPDFTIDFDMPYTYAFTPQVNGGLLKDAIPGTAMGGINFSEGIQLFFWWYTDPDCQDVTLVRELSTDYRITKVQHSIGLSGNTTQLSVSHLNVGVA